MGFIFWELISSKFIESGRQNIETNITKIDKFKLQYLTAKPGLLMRHCKTFKRMLGYARVHGTSKENSFYSQALMVQCSERQWEN